MFFRSRLKNIKFCHGEPIILVFIKSLLAYFLIQSLVTLDCCHVLKYGYRLIISFKRHIGARNQVFYSLKIHGIFVAMILFGHTDFHLFSFKDLFILIAAILYAPVGMTNQPFGYLGLVNCFLERSDASIELQAVAEVVPDYFS